MKASLLATVLAVGALADSATAAGTQVASYTGPAGVAGVMRVGGQAQGGSTTGVLLPTSARDRIADLTVADATGRPVFVELAQDRDGQGFVTDLGGFCSSAATPVRLAFPGRPLQVYVVAGACGSDVSAPTTGKITARFR
jgi:hypothetical protein